MASGAVAGTLGAPSVGCALARTPMRATIARRWPGASTRPAGEPDPGATGSVREAARVVREIDAGGAAERHASAEGSTATRRLALRRRLRAGARSRRALADDVVRRAVAARLDRLYVARADVALHPGRTERARDAGPRETRISRGERGVRRGRRVGRGLAAGHRPGVAPRDATVVQEEPRAGAAADQDRQRRDSQKDPSHRRRMPPASLLRVVATPSSASRLPGSSRRTVDVELSRCAILCLGRVHASCGNCGTESGPCCVAGECQVGDVCPGGPGAPGPTCALGAACSLPGDAGVGPADAGAE